MLQASKTRFAARLREHDANQHHFLPLDARTSEPTVEEVLQRADFRNVEARQPERPVTIQQFDKSVFAVSVQDCGQSTVPQAKPPVALSQRSDECFVVDLDRGRGGRCIAIFCRRRCTALSPRALR